MKNEKKAFIFLWIKHPSLFLQPNRSFTCGSSSFGRARPCQGRGGRFEPGLPLQVPLHCGIFFGLINISADAPVVELVDTQDLKSCSPQRE